MTALNEKVTPAYIKAYAKEHTQHYTDITEQIINAMCLTHTGKMLNIPSVSTSPLNDHCLKRAEDKNSPCYKCYSMRMMKRYKTLAEKLEKNTRLFTTQIIPIEQLPILPPEIKAFRFEAFSDLINAIQATNYINMCLVNPHIIHTIWTKNPQYLYNSMLLHGTEKPGNMIIIYSSPKLNKPAANMLKLYNGMIDKIFTVWTDNDTAAENDAIINCGKRSCNTCGLCYTMNNVKLIHELLK